MFEPRSPDEERDLNTFWNDLVRPSGAQDEAEGLPRSALAEAVQRLHNVGTAPPPASSRERVRRGLRSTYSSAPNGKEPTVHTMTSTLRLDSHLPARISPISSRSGWLTWPLVTCAAAAVLIAAIAGSFLAGRYINRSGSDGRGGIPAGIIQASPSPEADLATETLFEITLPDDTLAAESVGTIFLSRVTIPANSVSTQPNIYNRCCPGSQFQYVLEGSASVVSTGPTQVVRHDGAGTIEDHAAGESVEIGPGDLVIIRNVAGYTWTTGAANVEVVLSTLVGGYPSSPSPDQWPNHGYTADYRGVELPGGPYLLTLRQISVSDETNVALPDGGIDQLALVNQGKVNEDRALVGMENDGAINITRVRKPSQILLLQLSTTSEGTGTPIAGNPAAVAASPTP